jgi:GNAT superfamily N-acetyltransferase
VKFMDGLEIRPAASSEADDLAGLAARTFRDTFGASNRPEDLAEHLDRAFSPAQQRLEIAATDMRTLVAVHEGALIAFAQLRKSAPPATVTSAEPVEIWRFYVDQPWHGRGVAQRLMAAVLEAATTMGAGSVWLGVWEHNPRAAAFYRKSGFVAVGSHDFQLGQDRQTDVVMVFTRP